MTLKQILDNLYDGINVQVSGLVDGIEPKESAAVSNIRLYTSTTRRLCSLEKKLRASNRGKTTVNHTMVSRLAMVFEVVAVAIRLCMS